MCSEAIICFDVFKVILARFFYFFTVYFDRNFRLKMMNKPDGVSETAYGDSRFPLSLIILITHLFSRLHIKLCLLLWLNLGNWHVSNMKGALLLVSLSLLPPHSNLHLFWPNYRILLLLQFPEICLQFVSSFVSKRGHCKIHNDELPLRSVEPLNSQSTTSSFVFFTFLVRILAKCSVILKQREEDNIFKNIFNIITSNPRQSYLWGTEQPHKGSKVEMLSSPR